MKTLLIVDDEFDLLTIWRLVLEHSGYAVLTASDGAQALDLIRRKRPDLVFTDGMMPVMSGFELCEALYRDDALREIPIVLCSAAADIARQPNPHIAYCHKPLSLDAMLALVRKMTTAPRS